MTLSSPATAGIIVAIIFILLLGSGAFYYTNRRRRQNALSKAMNPASPRDSGSPALSLPQPKDINKRPKIPDPHHQQQQRHHTHAPSLEHGPGPTLITPARHDTPAIDTIKAVITTPATSSSNTIVQRPTSAASNNRSSLHQAMLDVGTEDGQKESNDAVKEANEDIRAKDLEHSSVGKAYTGAWPLRDVTSAPDGR